MKHRKRINRYPDLEAQGYGSRVTVYRRVRKGDFPKPIDILGRPAWTDEMLDEYDNSRKEIEYPAA